MHYFMKFLLISFPFLWHGFHFANPQEVPVPALRDFYPAGCAPFMWINYSHYPPRTPEILVLNLLAIAMATFIMEKLQEGPEGQVAIVVVAVFNKLQQLTPTMLSLEKDDRSSQSVPTWLKHAKMLLQGRNKQCFLATLETILNKFLDIPNFTSSFVNSKLTVAYYSLINDLKNACHLLSTTREARFVIPTDTKARRDLARYLTTCPVGELDIMLHRGVASTREMIVCNATGREEEGRKAMRSFGMVAAAFVRENMATEKAVEKDLMVWLTLQSTGVWQEVRFEWMPSYVAMGSGRRVLQSTTRFLSAKNLRAWAMKHGHKEALRTIQARLRQPWHDLESPSRLATSLAPRPAWSGQTTGGKEGAAARGLPGSDMKAGQGAPPTSPVIPPTSRVILNVPSPKPRHACEASREAGVSGGHAPRRPTPPPLITVHHQAFQPRPSAIFRPLNYLELLASAADMRSQTVLPTEPVNIRRTTVGPNPIPPSTSPAAANRSPMDLNAEEPLNLVMRVPAPH